MKSTLALAATAAASLSARNPYDARDLLQSLADRVDDNTTDYYIGYHDSDFDVPWAKYFNNSPIALSQEFMDGLERSPVSPDLATPFEDAGKALDQPGYLPLENGYTTLDDGTLFLAIRSDVPSCLTGEMYDFWFSWHVNDTTKYKLWNPGLHQYAALSEDQLELEQSKTGYREKYWNLTSFVDEYIGNMSYKLSIGFYDPRLLGFSLENPATGVETTVSAFVQLLYYTEEDPTSMAATGFTSSDVVLAHQVRRRPDGKGNEIRSRFWFGPLIVYAMKMIVDPDQLAHDLSVHCALEMTHLGTYLPALFEEFRDNVPT